jgi:putative hydrolase of the HAD superfamily
MTDLLIFDWGGTVMVDYALEGPMYLWEKVAWVDGAEEALKSLAAQHTLVIATNAPHSGTEEMIKALEMVNATPFFKRFFSSKELGHNKPDPRFFLAIAEEMKVPPARCVMIGNYYVKDISGAKGAGMKTIFYNEDNLPGPFKDADRVIIHMNQLIEAVDEVGGSR